MPKIKGIYNPPAQPPEEYYWKLIPYSDDPTGCILGLATRTGSLARAVLRITDGKLGRYTFSAADAADLGLTVTPDGFLATAAEREEMGIDLK